jgi:hypothetical protein
MKTRPKRDSFGHYRTIWKYDVKRAEEDGQLDPVEAMRVLGERHGFYVASRYPEDGGAYWLFDVASTQQLLDMPSWLEPALATGQQE